MTTWRSSCRGRVSKPPSATLLKIRKEKFYPLEGNPAGKERRDRVGENPGYRRPPSPLGGRISAQKGERRE